MFFDGHGGPDRSLSAFPGYQKVITISMRVPDRDPALDTLLELHGQTLFVDETGH